MPSACHRHVDSTLQFIRSRRNQFLFAASLLGLLPRGTAQVVPLTDVHLSGTDNQVQNGAELTIMSGGTFTAATGSVVDLFNATVAPAQFRHADQCKI
jgi:hypothetical protein